MLLEMLRQQMHDRIRIKELLESPCKTRKTGTLFTVSSVCAEICFGLFKLSNCDVLVAVIR
jgi:hypothetical protein